uniref:Uncharacterized protein n=1 Tax=Faxonius propinquus nudivirus TaxID=3139431 RepID=A0AAU8GC63_9VIRU
MSLLNKAETALYCNSVFFTKFLNIMKENDIHDRINIYYMNMKKENIIYDQTEFILYIIVSIIFTFLDETQFLYLENKFLEDLLINKKIDEFTFYKIKNLNIISISKYKWKKCTEQFIKLEVNLVKLFYFLRDDLLLNKTYDNIIDHKKMIFTVYNELQTFIGHISEYDLIIHNLHKFKLYNIIGISLYKIFSFSNIFSKLAKLECDDFNKNHPAYWNKKQMERKHLLISFIDTLAYETQEEIKLIKNIKNHNIIDIERYTMNNVFARCNIFFRKYLYHGTDFTTIQVLSAKIKSEYSPIQN